MSSSRELSPSAGERTGTPATPSWQPIESAPKDGTIIDVWRTEGGRDTVYWGMPPHCCGEMGQYCDSDWHFIKRPGWVCSAFGEFIGGRHDPFTHWMPLPAAPDGAERVHAPADRQPVLTPNSLPKEPGQ